MVSSVLLTWNQYR